MSVPTTVANVTGSSISKDDATIVTSGTKYMYIVGRTAPILRMAKFQPM